MYSLKDDYSELGHEKVLNDLLKFSNGQLDGYGLDSVSAEAQELIKKRFALGNADVHFLSGGTQTNLIMIHSALSPVEAVIAADTGHILDHECGSIESCGHKILCAPNYNGVLSALDIEAIYKKHTDEHMVKPKLVYISQATEKGTVYTKEELKDLYQICKKLGLYFYIDGARLGTALVSEGTDIKAHDMAKLCDAFYIGGTKNGSPLGEALCIINENLKKDFRYYLKQNGAMLAKGALIGSCFKTLFTDDLYFELANHSCKMAQKLSRAFITKGYKMSCPSPSNLIFPVVDNEKIKELQKHFKFHIWEKLDDKNTVIRIVCGFTADENEIEKFINML